MLEFISTVVLVLLEVCLCFFVLSDRLRLRVTTHWFKEVIRRRLVALNYFASIFKGRVSKLHLEPNVDKPNAQNKPPHHETSRLSTQHQYTELRRTLTLLLYLVTVLVSFARAALAEITLENAYHFFSSTTLCPRKIDYYGPPIVRLFKFTLFLSRHPWRPPLLIMRGMTGKHLFLIFENKARRALSHGF